MCRRIRESVSCTFWLGSPKAADPQTPPPGMQSIPPKGIPKQELGNEGAKVHDTLLRGDLGSIWTKRAFDDRMIFEALRLRFGRRTPGAALRVTERFGRRASSFAGAFAEMASPSTSVLSKRHSCLTPIAFQWLG